MLVDLLILEAETASGTEDTELLFVVLVLILEETDKPDGVVSFTSLVLAFEEDIMGSERSESSDEARCCLP